MGVKFIPLQKLGWGVFEVFPKLLDEKKKKNPTLYWAGLALNL